jgi:ribulose-phosphate 3-epimerase
VTTAVKLAPSILAADFARLGEQVREAEQAGADRIHVDVMDGHFVPNITMGPLVVQALRPVTRLPLEVHLMIEEPDRFLDAFVEAGADNLLVHVEGAVNLHRTIQHVKHLGKKAGVVLNPATSPVMLAEVLPDVDLVLAMTVNPGFGGQAFIPSMLGKVRRLRQLIDQVKPDAELEVDGGIDHATAPQAVQAGARVLVAGSAIFHAPDGVTAGLVRLRNSLS